MARRHSIKRTKEQWQRILDDQPNIISNHKGHNHKGQACIICIMNNSILAAD